MTEAFIYEIETITKCKGWLTCIKCQAVVPFTRGDVQRFTCGKCGATYHIGIALELGFKVGQIEPAGDIKLDKKA